MQTLVNYQSTCKVILTTPNISNSFAVSPFTYYFSQFIYFILLDFYSGPAAEGAQETQETQAKAIITLDRRYLAGLLPCFSCGASKSSCLHDTLPRKQSILSNHSVIMAYHISSKNVYFGGILEALVFKLVLLRTFRNIGIDIGYC